MIRFEHRAIPIVLAGRVDLAVATRIAGWMRAIFAVAHFAAGPVMGNLGDRFGRRPVLIARAPFVVACFGALAVLRSAASSAAWSTPPGGAYCRAASAA